MADHSRGRPTIVVVGLLPGQAAAVGRGFTAARLRFVECHGPPRLPGGDHVVLWLKFVSHAWSEAARRGWPRRRVHYHLGGLGGLTGLLTAIAGGGRQDGTTGVPGRGMAGGRRR